MTSTLDLTGRESIFSSQTPGGIGAEIGVDWGEFSLRIMALAKPRLMYLIDCWEIQSSEVYGSDPANTQQDVKYRQCLQRYTTDERFKMVKAYSLEAAEAFPDEYFDWLYIDANHLQAYQDCCAWWPKVNRGGWMLGHDYVDGGVGDYITTKADVDRFAAERQLTVLVTIDAGTEYKNWCIYKE